MEMQTQVLDRLLRTESGKKAYLCFCQTVERYQMDNAFRRGTLLGLSGGADSVLLLCLLLRYRSERADFPIVACHVHHGIRGEEAERDAAFCRDLCHSFDVPFRCVRVDVPAVCAKENIGLEEAARRERYAAFRRVMAEIGLSTIAVAHQATDNLETMVFHFLRGSGTHGLAGILPVRDDIVRPMIEISGATVRAALEQANIPYVTDSSNACTNYTRNYIRSQILPLFSEVVASAEVSATRLSQNLMADDAFIASYADEFLRQFPNGTVPLAAIAALEEAPFARVAVKMAKRPLEQSQILSLYSLVRGGGKFSYDIAGDCRFNSDGVCCFIGKAEPAPMIAKTIVKGENLWDDFRIVVRFADAATDFSRIDSLSNIYKISIQADLTSAIIKGQLYFRSAAGSETYRYGGMTHTVKKLWQTAKVPLSFRSRIPVLCDEKGIVWMPGFAVRDDREDGARGKGPFVRIDAAENASVAHPETAYNLLYIPTRCSSSKEKKGEITII